MVNNYIAGRSSIKIDQDESSRLLRFYHVLESQIQIHPTIGQYNCRIDGTITDVTNSLIWQPENYDSFGTYSLVLLPFKLRNIFRRI